MRHKAIKIFFSTLPIFVPIRVLAESETQTAQKFLSIQPGARLTANFSGDRFS